MTSSTKWIVGIFAVVAAFGSGMLLVQSGFASSIVTGELDTSQQIRASTEAIRNSLTDTTLAQQVPPHVFAGTVTVNGLTAPAGTRICVHCSYLLVRLGCL